MSENSCFSLKWEIREFQKEPRTWWFSLCSV